MRDYMRRTCDDIWVIDCSPEGHQPEVNTRIFQGVQQPVCIVLVSRSKATKLNIPANVHFQALPLGKREIKSSRPLRRSVWLDRDGSTLRQNGAPHFFPPHKAHGPLFLRYKTFLSITGRALCREEHGSSLLTRPRLGSGGKILWMPRLRKKTISCSPT